MGIGYWVLGIGIGIGIGIVLDGLVLWYLSVLLSCCLGPVVRRVSSRSYLGLVLRWTFDLSSDSLVSLVLLYLCRLVFQGSRYVAYQTWG